MRGRKTKTKAKTNALPKKPFQQPVALRCRRVKRGRGIQYDNVEMGRQATRKRKANQRQVNATQLKSTQVKPNQLHSTLQTINHEQWEGGRGIGIVIVIGLHWDWIGLRNGIGMHVHVYVHLRLHLCSACLCFAVCELRSYRNFTRTLTLTSTLTRIANTVLAYQQQKLSLLQSFMPYQS